VGVRVALGGHYRLQALWKAKKADKNRGLLFRFDKKSYKIAVI
jgi:hypothetical protein